MLEKTHSTGPVTHAIHAVREPARDAAIGRLLMGRDAPGAPRSDRKPFGLNREHLREITLSGLVALNDAYEAVADVFCHHANAPRVADGDRACGLLMDVAGETAQWARDQILAEIESRQPVHPHDRDLRLRTLIGWCAQGEEWDRVLVLIDEAMSGVGGR